MSQRPTGNGFSTASRRSARRLAFAVVAGWLLGAGGSIANGQAALPGGGSAGGKMPFGTLRDWTLYNNAGHRALDRGDLDRAASAFRQAIAEVRPYEAVERVLMARSNADFARVLFEQKRYDEAEPLARWALEVRKNEPGDRAEALVQSYLLLARIQRARRRPAEAAPLVAQAVAVQEKACGRYHTDLTATLEELADLHAELGKLPEAEATYRRALALRDLNSERNLRAAEDLELRARLLGDVSVADSRAFGGAGNVGTYRAQEAERMLNQARAAREASAVSHSSAATARRFAVTLRKAGKAEAADDMEVRAQAMRDEAETRAARARDGR